MSKCPMPHVDVCAGAPFSPTKNRKGNKEKQVHLSILLAPFQIPECSNVLPISDLDDELFSHFMQTQI